MTAPLTSAILDHLDANAELPGRGPLQSPQRRRERRLALGPRARASPRALSELRQALALDPKLRVLVAHGFTDLVTPYFASQLLLNQLPDLGPERAGRASQVYGGGHMFYTRDGSRQAFRDGRAAALIEEALRARGATNGG